MSKPLKLSEHQATWPHGERSTLVGSSGLQWHVQRWVSHANDKTTLVLIHGTGASAHSWAGLAPLLSQQFNVLSLDLPGHAFSELPKDAQMSSKGIAQLVLQLLSDLEINHCVFIGHSAGATIAIECLSLKSGLNISAIFSINGALLPFGSYNMPGMASFAKLMSKNRLIPKIFSLQARYVPLVDHLLDGTGSRIPVQSKQCYQVLVSNAHHARAALIMMAQWNLVEFSKGLPVVFADQSAQSKLILLACSGDRTVSPKISEQVHQQIIHSEIIRIPALGHLGHEENPIQFAKKILDILNA
jgi:magnesium chelatase accessory protein